MSRARQRANTRSKERQEKLRILQLFEKYGTLPVDHHAEEKLDLVDSFGKKDPTSYYAVKNIICGLR